MPDMRGNKVRVYMYLDPDVFRQIDDIRDPKMSRSEFCSTVITEALGIEL